MRVEISEGAVWRRRGIGGSGFERDTRLARGACGPRLRSPESQGIRIAASGQEIRSLGAIAPRRSGELEGLPKLMSK